MQLHKGTMYGKNKVNLIYQTSSSGLDLQPEGLPAVLPQELTVRSTF